MDFIYIQAPTYKKYTGDDDYELRPDHYRPELIDDTKKKLAENPTDVDHLNGYLPQGGLYIAEELLRRGMSVAILQDTTKKLYPKIDENVSSNTIAIGISTLSGDMLLHALDLAKYIRNKYPDIPIIWGGSHTTAVRDVTLKHNLVDYIVWGEGELVLPQLLDAISTGKGLEKIKGIGYKKDGKLFITERSEYNSLDRIFDLPYHLIEDMHNYTRKMIIGGDRWLPMISSRGCPFRCTFCHNTSDVYPMRQLRFHTTDNIIHNINKLIDNYDVDGIGFEDELTAYNDKRLVEICHALKEVNGNLSYRIATRVDLILRLKDETLKLMRDSGFVSVCYGIESGSQRMLNYMSKDITIKQVIEMDERLNKFGFKKSYNFLLGMPTETINDMKKSIKLLTKLGRNNKTSPYPCSQTPIYVPLPDTGMYRDAIKMGFNPPTNLEGWTLLDCKDPIKTRKKMRPWLKKDEIEFAVSADKKVAETSVHFTGQDADHIMIDRAMDSLDKQFGV